MWHTGRKSLFIHAEEVGNVSDEFFTWYLIIALIDFSINFFPRICAIEYIPRSHGIYITYTILYVSLQFLLVNYFLYLMMKLGSRTFIIKESVFGCCTLMEKEIPTIVT